MNPVPSGHITSLMQLPGQMHWPSLHTGTLSRQTKGLPLLKPGSLS